MARTDFNFGRGPAIPPKPMFSSDSTRLTHKKDSRFAVKTSASPWVQDTGLVPSDVDAVPESSRFPDFEDSDSSKDRGLIRSAKIPTMTPEPWSAALNESSDTIHYSRRGKSVKTKVHIKPILRKMSKDDAPSTSIDLSRSSTEQEGLGILLNSERDRRRSETLASPTFRRTSSGIQNRSTSGLSGSSGGKQGSQFVYPMRPTPRGFTPPLSQSYQTSNNDSDEAEDDVESEIRKVSPEPPRPVRTVSGSTPRLSLQIEDDSYTRLPGISQTNVSGRPSFGYSRDNGSALDTTASPISRTSLDYVFRSRTRTSTDPISRAATVQAARQAFEEKEAAKTRRLEKQQIKAEEKQIKRRVNRTNSEGLESPAARSSEKVSEEPRNPEVPPVMGIHDRQQSASWKSQSKSTWMLFITWLRTRVFKFRRKLRKTS
ncbi:hypothetical protein N7495_007207 [Penicillium taxi]|uniref:uncharacterized protein n=1 Tax=Penicillium taxi TaxID=168475 RepID=UPI002544FA5A|nr:uncharacterized protein N7495_007207 [Penicillium taxi]KAJ5895516.1 hypothetical protein N7495_007207 [Penicillium taxi]